MKNLEQLRHLEPLEGGILSKEEFASQKENCLDITRSTCSETIGSLVVIFYSDGRITYIELLLVCLSCWSSGEFPF